MLLDDRDKKTSPGVKFADMELIGIPHRVVISDRGLADGTLEYKHRRDSEAQAVAIADILPSSTLGHPADRQTMLNQRVVIQTGAVLCAALLLAGCANHLPQRSEHEARTERKLLDHSLRIEVGDPWSWSCRSDASACRNRRPSRSPTSRSPVAMIATRRISLARTLRDTARRGRRGCWYRRERGECRGARQRADHRDPGLDQLWFRRAQPVHERRNQWPLAAEPGERSGATARCAAGVFQPAWAERPVTVQAGEQSHQLNTDRNGILRLNLLDGPFADQDIAQIGKLQLSVEDDADNTRADAVLLVSHNLRSKLQEAHALIFDDLEGDDVSRWVYRVKRLSELALRKRPASWNKA